MYAAAPLIQVPAYAASKGAVGQLIKALSNEWAKHNVQVNGIAPGYIATDMVSDLCSHVGRAALAYMRSGTASVAHFATFAASRTHRTRSC